MTDWLKKVDVDTKGKRVYDELVPWLQDCKEAEDDQIKIIESLTQLKVYIDRELEFLGKKESSLFDNPEYQRADENKGDSGDFDPTHVLDSRPKSDFTSDVGVASTTPGSSAPNSPGRGLAEGLFD